MGFLLAYPSQAGYSSAQNVPNSAFGDWYEEGSVLQSAANRVIAAGQSPMLRDLLQGLAQIEGVSGPKFSRKSLHILAQAIACRTYEKMALELVHLVRAVALTAGRNGYEGVFWGMERAAASAFRGHFGAVSDLPGRLIREEGGVLLKYPDGRFAVRYGRMPVLSAFLEFCVAALGYAKLSEILEGIDAAGLSAGDQSKSANALSRALYEFLGDHLPTVQSQRKFRSLIAYLEGALGRDFRPEAVGDEDVLGFWQEASTGDDTGDTGDFRAYRTVFLAFLRLIELLEDGDALARFERMHAIGSDREAGEVDPGEDAYLASRDFAENDPLGRFQEPPLDHVKFLNKRETDTLSIPSAEGHRLYRLRQSYLRAETFGVGQHRLIQALRRKAGMEELEQIAKDAAPESYGQRISGLQKIDGHLEKTALAAFHVLGAGDATSDLATRARKAFESLSRQGFENDRIADPDIREAFEAAAEPLASVRERLNGLIDVLGDAETWAEAYEEDRTVFADQFLRLYGENA